MYWTVVLDNHMERGNSPLHMGDTERFAGRRAAIKALYILVLYIRGPA